MNKYTNEHEEIEFLEQERGYVTPKVHIFEETSVPTKFCWSSDCDEDRCRCRDITSSANVYFFGTVAQLEEEMSKF